MGTCIAQVKPTGDFYAKRVATDGLKCYCKVCEGIHQSQSRKLIKSKGASRSGRSLHTWQSTVHAAYWG
jgi:hypothetical protein